MKILNRMLIVLALLAAACGLARAARASDSQTSQSAFAQQVNLKPIATLAIYTDGRVKSFDSFARQAMQFISGGNQIKGQSPGFTYLDMMLRPEQYANADIIYIKNKEVRDKIAKALKRSAAEQFDTLAAQMTSDQSPQNAAAEPPMKAKFLADLDDRMATFMKSGLISAPMLQDQRVVQVLDELARNVLLTAKFIDAIEGALSVMDAGALRANLHFVAPPGGGFEDRWLTIDELSDPSFENGGMAVSAVQAKDTGGTPVPPPSPRKIDPQLKTQLASQWSAFTRAWKDSNAAAVNDAAVQLAALLPTVNPQVYPAQSRLKWENFYFNAGQLTWVWPIYGLSMIFLLLGVVFRWGPARAIGLSIFTLAFLIHSTEVGLRWYVSGRWPNSNMFEAVTTAAWFGGCLAMLLEIVLRKSPMRNLFALGSAAACMTAMMAVRLYPLELNANISNKMPVLNDIWLYIHTNVIIFSYCLIFIAAVVAMIYLGYRAVAAMNGGSSGGAEMQYARVGGAGSLIMVRPDGTDYLASAKTTFGQILDGTTMVVMEMSFILLWTGLCMGAIWADHSWGRPWGWDPKEVFALNTFIIFLLLVHVRLKVKDKGLWTALLAVVGAGVMLFNWIIINFAISGLHSYA